MPVGCRFDRRRMILVAVVLWTAFTACSPDSPEQGGGDTGGPGARPVGVDVPTDTSLQQQRGKIEWHRPRFDEREDERLDLVRRFIEPEGNVGPVALQAMRDVPRHRFIPQSGRGLAYHDFPVPIGEGQTISQPSLVAYMTELLALEPGDKVLEIGTGSGYQAAVLSELTPNVYTIEIIGALANRAKKTFEELGYGTIKSRRADGYYGWKEQAPFDAIIVTAAAGHVPPPLVEQLRPGGRMVIPIGGVFVVQQLMLIVKDEEGRISSRSILPVRFVPMTGRVMEVE